MSGDLVEVDLTEKIKLFSPLTLVYLTDISHIDISGCRFVDADLLVDCIVFCSGLKKLEMAFCTQFKEEHFCVMLPKLANLKYADFQSSLSGFCVACQ